MHCLNRYLNFLIFFLFSSLFFFSDVSGATQIDDYTQLREWKFSDESIPVEQKDFKLSRDTATWSFESGEIRLMKPTSEGKVTGLVFEGKGRFTMTIPDEFEMKQLQRFSHKDDLTSLDQQFSQLVLRTSEDFITSIFPEFKPETYVQNKTAVRIHERYLKKALFDIDARIIAGLSIPGDEYLCIDMNTDSLGWIRYLFDGQELEEIVLSKLQKTNDYNELWVCLDRENERLNNGKPSTIVHEMIDIAHYDITADLTKISDKPVVVTMSHTKPTRAVFNVAVTFMALRTGPEVLRFSLNPDANVKEVINATGKSLVFIRDHIGEDFTTVKKDYCDPYITVFLEKPLIEYQQRQLTFTYEMDILTYTPGGGWLPEYEYNYSELSTASITATIPNDLEFRAIGKQTSENTKDNFKTVRWEIDRPTAIIGFAFGKNFVEEKITFEGIPEVISFGEELGFTTGNLVKNVAIDTAKSLKFYKWLYDIDLPVDTVYTTRIPGYHGQSFLGFIQLSEYTYAIDIEGASELFRAHEAAHQYWGHVAGWKTYRDQWLSEAFAEYSALLFIETTLEERGQEIFQEIIDVYVNQLTGSIKTSLSKFSRPMQFRLDYFDRQEMGPIGAGFRASTARVPEGYFVQSYQKGAIVLHMLRSIFRTVTKNDDLFRALLSDFLKTYQYQNPSTEDFIKLVNKHTNMDWRWFFDQWVYGTSIPTYTWEYSLSKSSKPDKKFDAKIKIHQTEVPSDFKMIVPLKILYKDKTEQQFTMTVDEEVETFTISLNKKPKHIILNPDNAVLAKVIDK